MREEPTASSVRLAKPKPTKLSGEVEQNHLTPTRVIVNHSQVLQWIHGMCDLAPLSDSCCLSVCTSMHLCGGLPSQGCTGQGHKRNIGGSCILTIGSNAS